MKPRVFIGSSREHLDLARAVQENLDPDLETKVWDQDVFKLSEYPLEALAAQLQQSDFGVFVMASADWATIRGTKHSVPRDNVVFELGLFAGHLGRLRTFVITPRHSPGLHLPTDLLGLTIGDYDADRRDGSLTAAVAPVCNKIRRLVVERAPTVLKQRTGLVRFGLFSDFVGDFDQLLNDSSEVVLYFIHSRRWRENHNDGLRKLLGKVNSSLMVFLPDLANTRLVTNLMGHFDDGPHIPGFIEDAYRYFLELQREFHGKVRILLFNVYPTYTFYKFDDAVIAAMYPTTAVRKSVPAFHLKTDGTFGEFLHKDIEHLIAECKEPSPDELLKIGSAGPSYSKEHAAQERPANRSRRRGTPASQR